MMAVIELGILGAGGDVPPPGPRFRYGRRSLRQLAATLVAALCLVSLHASARPARAGLHPAWTIAFPGGDAFAPGNGNVYVLRDGTQQVLTAYALATGKVRWTTSLPYAVTSLTPAESGGVLLLPAQARSVAIRPSGGDVLWANYSTLVVALDAATGRELWRSPGDVALTTGDAVLLIDHQPDGLGAQAMRLVGLRDGMPRWARDAGGAYRWVTIGPPDRPDRLVTASPSGDLRVYRFADGTPEAGARVRWLVGSLTDVSDSDIAAQGGLLYVFTTGVRGTTVTAYAPDTLRPVWTTAGAAGAGPSPCGAVLCVPTANGFAAQDWLTGAERWRVPGYDLGRPLIGDLLLVGDEEAGRAVLDDRTGRVVTYLGPGGAAWDPVRRIVVTLVPTTSPPHRVAVGRLDPRTGEVFLLGTIDPVVNSFWCRLAGSRLICSTPDGRLVITDVG